MLSLFFKKTLNNEQDRHLYEFFKGFPQKYEYDVADVDLKFSVYLGRDEGAEEIVHILRQQKFEFGYQIHHGKSFFCDEFLKYDEDPMSPEGNPSENEERPENHENLAQNAGEPAEMGEFAAPPLLSPISAQGDVKPSVVRQFAAPFSPSTYVTFDQMTDFNARNTNRIIEALETRFSQNVTSPGTPVSAGQVSANSTMNSTENVPNSIEFTAKNELIANGIRCEKCSIVVKGISPISKLIMAVRDHVIAHFDEKYPLLKRFECRECGNAVRTNFVDDFENHLKKHGSMMSMAEKRQKLTSCLLTETHLKHICALSNACFPEVFEKTAPAINTILASDTPAKAKVSVFPRLNRHFCFLHHIPNSMESLQNGYQRARWALRKWLNFPSTTIAPVLWLRPKLGAAHAPSAHLRARLSAEENRKIDKIWAELLLISRLTTRFPDKMGDPEWRVMLKLTSRKQRLDQCHFEYKKEKLAAEDVRLRAEKQAERRADAQTAEQNRRKFGGFLLANPSLNCEKWLKNRTVIHQFRLETQPILAVDCQFLEHLSHRGRALTAMQLQYLAVQNREKTDPFRLFFVNFHSSSPEIRELERTKLSFLRQQAGLNPVLSDQGLRETFQGKEVIYLSPDAEEELETVDDNKVYVLGGIVDRVPEPGIARRASLEAAHAQGVSARKLPIDRYVQFRSGTKFLTLLAVADILREVNESGNWKKAMETAIPVRNVRAPEHKNPNAKAAMSRIHEFNREILRRVERVLGKDEAQKWPETGENDKVVEEKKKKRKREKPNFSMKNEDLERLARDLSAKHFWLKTEWLKTCVEYLEQYLGKKMPPFEKVLDLVVHQFVNTQISDSFEPIMRIPTSAIKVFIVKRMIFQLQSYTNISISLHEQLTECTRHNDDLSWFHGGKSKIDESEEKEKDTTFQAHSPLKQAKNAKKRGMLKLELTDGVNTVKAIETEEIFEESQLKNGCKIMLIGKVKCRRGTLFLEKSNCLVLGGQIDSLRVEKVKQLSAALKIDLEAEKKRKTESIEKSVQKDGKSVKKQLEKSKNVSQNQSTISPFLVKTDRKTGEVTNPPKPPKKPALAETTENWEFSIEEIPPPAQTPTPEPSEFVEEYQDPIDEFIWDPRNIPKKSTKRVESVERTFNSTSSFEQGPHKKLEKFELPPKISAAKPMRKQLPEELLEDDEIIEDSQEDPPPPQSKKIVDIKNSGSEEEEVTAAKKARKGDNYAAESILPPCFRPEKIDAAVRAQKAEEYRQKTMNSFAKTIHGPRYDKDKPREKVQRIKPNPPQIEREKAEKSRRAHILEEEKEADEEDEEEEELMIVEEILSKMQEDQRLKLPEKVQKSLSTSFEEDSKSIHDEELDDSILECTIEQEGRLELQRWGLETSRKRDAQKTDEFDDLTKRGRAEDYARIDEEEDRIYKRYPPVPQNQWNHHGYNINYLSADNSQPQQIPPQKHIKIEENFGEIERKKQRKEMSEKREEIKNKQSTNVQIYKTPFAKRIPSTDQTSSFTAQLFQRMADLNIVPLGDALINRKYWMMSKIVIIMPTICHQVHELKSDGIDWQLQMRISDTSASDVTCLVATDLLNRIFGFSVQQCKNLFNAKQFNELRVKKIEAERKLQGFKRLDLLVWIEISPDPQKLAMILDVKTLSDALNIL
ncbi:unnamed protein product [Caenorhabditis sp. 36 PRJEB53466]|nr:unnamed protein product [Caenorhabditis sp. 36 PRJEB53466]